MLKSKAARERVAPGSIVYICYRDHLIFRNCDPNLFQPAMRECVGWVMKESDDAIWVVFDKSTKLMPYERTQPKESGLVILRSDICKLRRLDFC